MNSNDVKAIAAIGSSCAVLLATVKTIDIMHKREEAKREAIRQEANRQIRAIHIAKMKVIKKINNGEYDRNLTIDNVMNDLKFETIAARFNE